MESDVLTVRTGPMIGLIAQFALLTVLSAAAGLGSLGLVVGLACGASLRPRC